MINIIVCAELPDPLGYVLVDKFTVDDPLNTFKMNS
jgi:hypothetical protein